ncbi:unnamed protein product [Discula destructiva]
MSTLDTQTIPSALAVTKQQDTAINTLPKDFPTCVNGKAAWTGVDFKTEEQFVYILSGDEISEVCQALVAFKDQGLEGTSINKENFVLPTLGAKLHGLSQEVHQGRGFAVVRGLDANKFPGGVGDLTMVYMGIASYISDQVGRQDGSGNALVHIIADKGESAHHRHGTDAITFHTEEAADVVAWLTRGAAAVGGHCIISSAATVYNVLGAARPDLVRVLAAGNWPFALPRYLCRPVIFNENGRVLFNFGRAALMGSTANPRKAHLPTITAKQLEALDAIESIARATEFAFTTQPGDMHFINNMAVLHRRDGFTNDADQSRHLVRMRLSDSVYGTGIPSLRREWADAFNEEGDRTFHIEPMPAGYFPLRKYPN